MSIPCRRRRSVPRALGWSLAWVLVAPLSAHATDRYVAPGGGDGNPGTSGSPWLTLQHAVESVAPGDVIFVRAGTYAGARIEASGTPLAPITLRSAPGEAVLLNTPGPNNVHNSIIEVETFDAPEVVSYWVIEGFEFTGAGRSGVDLRNTTHITVRGNNVHDSGLTGIFTAFSDDVLIENNESHHNGEHGVYTSNSGDRPHVRGNRLHHNVGAGVHMNADLSQGPDGIISNAVVERNVIFENGTGGGAGINMDGIVNSVVRNNLLYENHASGIAIFQEDGAVCSHDNRVLNNTISMATNGRWAILVALGDTSLCTGNQLLHNILFNKHAFHGSIAVYDPAPAGFVSDYNVVMDRFSTDSGDTNISFNAWKALGFDAHSFIATPAQIFVNAAANDYRLSASSLAIDAGTTVPDVPVDLNGLSRPQRAGFDVGAYEAGATDLIFADGFEFGNLSAWSSSAVDSGDLSARPEAALASSTTGLAAVIDDTAGIYVQDDSPNSESRYRARFYFDARGFDPGEAAGHFRTRMMIAFNDASQRLVAIVLRRQGGAYSVMARVRQDDGSRVSTPFVPITSAPHFVEFDWQRSSGPGANSGSLQMWIDNVSVATLGGIDNDGSTVGFARLGALSVKTGASGTLFFDQFESRRLTFIGP